MTAVSAAQGAVMPCPGWCDPGAHDSSTEDTPVHHSSPRAWENDSSVGSLSPLRFEVSFRRGDEIFDGGRGYLVGGSDLTVRVTGCAWEFTVDERGRPVLEGDLSPNAARQLGAWLTSQAEEVDPDHADGHPLGYVVDTATIGGHRCR